MKTIKIFLFAALLVLLAACSQTRQIDRNDRVTLSGSGKIASREVETADFDQLEAGMTFDLTIRQGEDFKVVLSSDDNFIDYLQVDNNDGRASFGFKPGYAYDIKGVTLRAEVTVPVLAGLALSGSAHAGLEGLSQTRSLDVELSGSSSLDGGLEASKANIELSGSTYVKLEGSVEELELNTCGNSIADLSEFQAENAVIQASCASQSVMSVSGMLEGDVAQNSQLFYVGQPVQVDIRAHEFALVEEKK